MYRSALLHIFASFFGVIMSWTLVQKQAELQHDKEKLDRKTALFSMMGESMGDNGVMLNWSAVTCGAAHCTPGWSVYGSLTSLAPGNNPA